MTVSLPVWRHCGAGVAMGSTHPTMSRHPQGSRQNSILGGSSPEAMVDCLFGIGAWAHNHGAYSSMYIEDRRRPLGTWRAHER